MPDELIGLTMPTYDADGKLKVNLSDVQDELNRPYIRSESRDDHDSTYFVCSGDEWTLVENFELEDNSNGVQTEWYLPHKEIKNVKIRIESEQSSSSSSSELTPDNGFTVDYSSFDYSCNQADHFSRGKIIFDESPEIASKIFVDYEYASIGTGNEMIFDQSVDGSTKEIDIRFCDPVHIKDGLVVFENGTFDSKINLYCYCPQIGTYMDDRLDNYEVAPGVFYRKYHFYKDDNDDVQLNQGGDLLIAHYVINQRLFGSVYVGLYFDVEARSTPFPPGYFIRASIDAGSASDLKGYARLEINRQRTSIK